MIQIASQTSLPDPFLRFSDLPLRVLTPDLGDRIARVNKARRVLANAGYTVVRQDLRARMRPVLELAIGDPELRRLASGVRRVSVDGRELECGRFADVDVQWPVANILPLVRS